MHHILSALVIYHAIHKKSNSSGIKLFPVKYLLSLFLLPNPRDLCPTEPALPSNHVILQHHEVDPMDEPPAALWTIGAVGRVPRRIPDVDIF